MHTTLHQQHTCSFTADEKSTSGTVCNQRVQGHFCVASNKENYSFVEPSTQSISSIHYAQQSDAPYPEKAIMKLKIQLTKDQSETIVVK